MSDRASGLLDRARLKLGLTQAELWFHYFELGGMSSALDVEAYLVGVLEPSAHDHDLIAHALNEFFSELGQNHPVPYFADGLEKGEQERANDRLT